MPSERISEMDEAEAVEPTDEIMLARDGANLKVTAETLLADAGGGANPNDANLLFSMELYG